MISWWDIRKQACTVKRFGVVTLRNAYNGGTKWMSRTELHPNRLANRMYSIRRTSFSIWGFYRTSVSRVYITEHWPTTIFWWYHVTMLNACAEAHAFAPLRFAHAVEMWYFGSLASRSPIRQAGTRTGTTSSTSHPSSNPQRHLGTMYNIQRVCCMIAPVTVANTQTPTFQGN